MNPVMDLARTLLGKRKTETGRWLGACRKAIREAWISSVARLKLGYHRTRKSALWMFKGIRREFSIYRARDRGKTRFKKTVERSSELLEERRARLTVKRSARGRGLVLVGPWISEVGYEVLYWIPFVQAAVRQHHRLSRDRLVVVSRGGAAPWYDHVADRYIDVFDLMSTDEFAEWSNRRLESGGTHKQFEPTPLDRELAERAKRQLGVDNLSILHPGAMYRMFNHYWYGRRPFRIVWNNTRYLTHRMPPVDATWDLPSKYVAVKFYSGRSMPDTPEIRASLRQIVVRIAERRPVVLLDTGLLIDDHEDFSFAGNPNIRSARSLMLPRDNLAVQSRIIAGSELFVGTCGSLAWLAPMLGVDTVALYANPDFLHTHLRVGHRVYESLGAGHFAPVDLRGAEWLRLL